MAQVVLGLGMMLGGFFVLNMDMEGDSVQGFSKADMFKMSLSDAQLKARIRSGEDFVVVGFAPWCIACKRFAPVFGEARSELGDRLVAYNADAGKALDVNVFPTLIRYKGGKEVKRQEGSLPLADLIKFAK